MKLLTSSSNPLIKHLIKLNQSPSYRKEEKSLLIEGKKLILEYLKNHQIKNLFVKEGLSTLYDLSPVYLKEDLCTKISSLKTNDGYFAEINHPKEDSLEKSTAILVIDQLQDPGNLGTLIRSALAFNFDGIFILDQSVDPYSPKVIRASMGAIFHIPIMRGDFSKLNEFIKSRNLNVYIAEASGKPAEELKIERPLALVLGNEANGSQLKNNSIFHKISIPIENVDSLNVAIAGSLLMFQLKSIL